MTLIDVNAAAGFWPIQRFSWQGVKELNDLFQAEEISIVWLSAVESILFPEPDYHDFRLFRSLSSFPRFRPVKTVNPVLGNWEKSCRQAQKEFSLAAIKLFPNYHGYSLSTEAVKELCHFAIESSLPVLVQMRVNDERNQPFFMQVAGVPAHEIADLSLCFPKCRIIALCAYYGELDELARGGSNLLTDIAFLDVEDVVEKAAEIMSIGRVTFGTHTPFLHARSAILKLAHSELSQDARAAIAGGNIGIPSFS